jgi:hypothetical protein
MVIMENDHMKKEKGSTLWLQYVLEKIVDNPANYQVDYGCNKRFYPRGQIYNPDENHDGNECNDK